MSDHTVRLDGVLVAQLHVSKPAQDIEVFVLPSGLVKLRIFYYPNHVGAAEVADVCLGLTESKDIAALIVNRTKEA